MKIYFEDGRMGTLGSLPENVDDTIDARNGVSLNIDTLNEFKQREEAFGENLVIYTNSIFAFDNRYAWNDELKVPEIYIRTGRHMVFTRIDKLTNRELKKGHNLAKMYVGGEFEEDGTMYDINKRKRFKTVGELREILNDIPDNTQVLICGEDYGWFHIEQDNSVVCLDSEDLEECYEENNEKECEDA